LNIRKAELYVKTEKGTKWQKNTCITREAKESLGTILAEKILGFAPRISCQYRYFLAGCDMEKKSTNKSFL
jgi:hypothetical protein